MRRISVKSFFMLAFIAVNTRGGIKPRLFNASKYQIAFHDYEKR